MTEQSPLEFCVQRAAELGIREEDLCPNSPVVNHDQEPSRRRNTLQYASRDNVEGIYFAVLIRGRFKYDSRSAGRVTGWSLEEEYEFMLAKSNESARLMMRVNKGSIKECEHKESDYFGEPKEFFSGGRDYHDALDWMLRKYAASFRPVIVKT